MDWAVVGALTSVVAVILAYLQLSHARQQRLTAPIVPSPMEMPEPPELHYELWEGQGSYPFPQDWMAKFPDPNRDKHLDMKHQLDRFAFGLLQIKNTNKHACKRVDLHLGATGIWSCRIEKTRKLASGAVQLHQSEHGLQIKIEEMPAGEEILISVIAGGVIFSYVGVNNAAVKLERIS